MTLHNTKFTFCLNAAIFLSLLFCSCASVSQKNTDLAQQNLANQNYDTAFSQVYKALLEDAGNKDAILIFPEAYNKAIQDHNVKLGKAKQDNSLETVADEYDRLVEINDKANEIKMLIEENYKEILSDNKKKNQFLSTITSPFSVPKEDLKKITDLNIPNLNKEKDIAHEKVSAHFYEEGQLLVKERKLREASSKFGKAYSYVPDYKDAKELEEKYKKMADEAEAHKYYEEGQKLAREKDYRGASNKFNQVHSYVPGYKDARKLEEKYKRMADEAEAQKYYEEGQKLAREQDYKGASRKFREAQSYVQGFKDAEELEETYKRMAFDEEIKNLRFMGVYIKQGEKFVEVPRIPPGELYKYNVHQSPMGDDYNIKSVTRRDLFVSISIEDFNKDGFIVKEDRNWSDFVLMRVPHTGKYRNNESGSIIITNVAYGGPFGMPYSTEYLDPEIGPTEWCSLRKAKVAEDTYIYVPSRNVERGLYLIDYKKNGKSFKGWNAIEVR